MNKVIYIFLYILCNGLKDWAIPAIKILSDSNTEGIDYIMRRSTNIKDTKYVRLQYPLKSPIDLDSTSKEDMEKLKEFANKTYEVSKETLDRFIANMIIK